MSDKHLPTDVNVHGLTSYSGRAAAGWNLDGARWHVWFDIKTFEYDDVVYKNPPLGLDRKDPAHFDTRKLAAIKRQHLIAEVFAQIKAQGLLAKAQEAEQAKQRARQEESDAAVRAERIRDAAPELLEALKGLLADITEYQTINNLGGENNHWQVIARAAIAKATGATHDRE